MATKTGDTRRFVRPARGAYLPTVEAEAYALMDELDRVIRRRARKARKAIEAELMQSVEAEREQWDRTHPEGRAPFPTTTAVTESEAAAMLGVAVRDLMAPEVIRWYAALGREEAGHREGSNSARRIAHGVGMKRQTFEAYVAVSPRDLPAGRYELDAYALGSVAKAELAAARAEKRAPRPMHEVMEPEVEGSVVDAVPQGVE